MSRAHDHEVVSIYPFTDDEVDALLADLFGASREMMDKWINPGRYVGGAELASAGAP